MKLELLDRFPGMAALEVIFDDYVKDCTKCRHYRNRDRSVFGLGASESPHLAFVGDGATTEETRTGEPFVGAEGALYDALLDKLGYTRLDVFSMQAVCCPPSPGKNITPPHVEACLPNVVSQLRAVGPCVAVALGQKAGLALTGIGRPTLGMWYPLQLCGAQTEVPVQVIVTHSLKAMLHPKTSETTRNETWGWLQAAMEQING